MIIINKCLVLILAVGALCLCSLSYADTSNITTLSDSSKSIIVNSINPSFSIKLKTIANNDSVWLLKEIDRNLISPIKKVSHHDVIKGKKNNSNHYEEWVFEVNQNAFKVPMITNVTLIYAQPSTMQNVQGSNFRIVIIP